MATKRAIERYYDGMSLFYRWFYSAAGLHYGLWKHGTWTLRQALFNHKDAILNALSPVTADSELLDAGCGLGRTALYFHELTGARVTGITLSDYQVAQARRLAAARGANDGLAFHNADFTDTPFPDARFSHAFAVESFCHAPDKPAFLREMYRVLRPGGRLVIADFFLDRPEAELDERQRHYHERVKEGFVIPGFANRKQTGNQAEAAGFRVTADADVTRAVRRTAYHIQARAWLTLPFGYLLGALRLAPPELIPHLRCCAVQSAALNHLGSYRLITLDKPD